MPCRKVDFSSHSATSSRGIAEIHTFISIKIESCSAGFSACGGSRSDKFCSAAVRSTRSAFLLYRKCDAISYKAKKEDRSHYNRLPFLWKSCVYRIVFHFLFQQFPQQFIDLCRVCLALHGFHRLSYEKSQGLIFAALVVCYRLGIGIQNALHDLFQFILVVFHQ